MADDKDQEDFQPPKFDEDAFVHREMVSFRTTAILFAWGIIAALLSWIGYTALDGAQSAWYLGLLICAVFGYALKFLFPRLGADIAHFKRKDWFGTGALFFFTWLSFFLVAVNPPLGDHSPPQIEMALSPAVPAPGQDAVLTVLAADNTGVQGDPTFVIKRGQADVPFTVENKGHGIYNLSLSGVAAGSYDVTVTAQDGGGRATTATHAFKVQEVLTVFPPRDNVFKLPEEAITVKSTTPFCGVNATKPCLVGVTLESTDNRNITMRYKEDVGGWSATVNHAGWVKGANNVTVKAHFQDTFVSAKRVPGGAATAGPYNLDVQLDPGTYVPDAKNGGPLNQPAAPKRHTPGFDVLWVLPVVLGIAFLARRKLA